MDDFYETSYVKAGRDGRRPRLCVTYHDEDGRRHERTRAAESKRGSALRREAEEWRMELNRQREEDRERRERERREALIPKVGDYVRDYLADREMGGDEPSTILSYINSMQLVIDPKGGVADLRLDMVGPAECRAWMRYLMNERRLSADTIRSALALLRMALDRAEEEQVIVRNGISKVKGPRVAKDSPNALDRRSVASLREWVCGGCDWFRTAVGIALFTGMRRGEICGLRWRDIDFDKGELHVRHAIGRGRRGPYLKTPKNRKQRSFGMPDELVAVLHRRRKWFVSELLKLYPDDVAEARLGNLYVCGEVDGRWRVPNVVTVTWDNSRGALGVRGIERDLCKFHDLRHTFATYMLQAGHPVKEVAAILGHSSAAMTLDVYAGVDMESICRVSRSAGAALPSLEPSESDDAEPVYELPAATK